MPTRRWLRRGADVVDLAGRVGIVLDQMGDDGRSFAPFPQPLVARGTAVTANAEAHRASTPRRYIVSTVGTPRNIGGLPWEPSCVRSLCRVPGTVPLHAILRAIEVPAPF